MVYVCKKVITIKSDGEKGEICGEGRGQEEGIDAVGGIDAIVTGEDLIDLGLKPGPHFKEHLDHIVRIQLERDVSKDVILMELRLGIAPPEL